MTEIEQAIQNWKDGTITREELNALIMEWAQDPKTPLDVLEAAARILGKSNMPGKSEKSK